MYCKSSISPKSSSRTGRKFRLNKLLLGTWTKMFNVTSLILMKTSLINLIPHEIQSQHLYRCMHKSSFCNINHLLSIKALWNFLWNVCYLRSKCLRWGWVSSPFWSTLLIVSCWLASRDKLRRKQQPIISVWNVVATFWLKVLAHY